ncbi:MAG: hypothetical protein H7Z43_08815, partial [Clostridia bacterium]|nr:hypothetical protein [Deltaproteobacteria bacterium]
IVEVWHNFSIRVARGEATSVRSRNVERTVTTLHGEQTVTRNYYNCRSCGTGFYPRDAELGLPAEGALSLEMERRVLDFAVSGPYEECAGACTIRSFRCRRINSAKWSNALVVVLKKPTGGVFSASVKAVEPFENRDCLTVLNDGSMFPGLHGWHEAKVGAIVRNGVASEARYVAVWGEQDEFHAEMRAALDAERWQSSKDHHVDRGRSARELDACRNRMSNGDSNLGLYACCAKRRDLR